LLPATTVLSCERFTASPGAVPAATLWICEALPPGFSVTLP